MIRIEHQGHLNKRLCGLLVSGDDIPSRGAAILSGDRAAGTVTSAERSPALGRVIALGSVRRECWEPGTRLRVGSETHRLDVEVVPLPFVGQNSTT